MPNRTIIAQMTTVSEGLNDIKGVLTEGVARLSPEPADVQDENGAGQGSNPQLGEAIGHLAAFSQQLQSIKESLTDGLSKMGQVAASADSKPPQQVQVVYKVPRAFLDVIKAQFAIMESWLEPIVSVSKGTSADASKLTHTVDEAFRRYEALIQRMEDASQSKSPSKSD